MATDRFVITNTADAFTIYRSESTSTTSAVTPQYSDLLDSIVLTKIAPITRIEFGYLVYNTFSPTGTIQINFWNYNSTSSPVNTSLIAGPYTYVIPPGNLSVADSYTAEINLCPPVLPSSRSIAVEYRFLTGYTGTSVAALYNLSGTDVGYSSNLVYYDATNSSHFTGGKTVIIGVTGGGVANLYQNLRTALITTPTQSSPYYPTTLTALPDTAYLGITGVTYTWYNNANCTGTVLGTGMTYNGPTLKSARYNYSVQACSPNICLPPPVALSLNNGSINSQYVDIGGAGLSPLNGLTSFSFTGWIYLHTGAVNNTRIFEFGNDTTHTITFFTNASTALSYTIANGTSQTLTSSIILAAQWYYVGLTYDAPSTTATIYVNGDIGNISNVITIRPLDVGSTLMNWFGRSIVASGSSIYFSGAYDEFRFWNFALSATQIRQSIDQEISPQTHGLVAYYRFNEGTDNLTADSTRAPLGVGTIHPYPTWTYGFTGPGGPVSGHTGLGFVDDIYVSLGYGANPLKALTSFSFECWFRTDATITGGTRNYERLWDFGNTSATGYLYFTPRNTTAGPSGVYYGISLNGPGSEQFVRGNTVLHPSTWYHLALVYANNINTAIIYVNGIFDASATITTTPAALGNTINNWFGRSQFGDPLLKGVIDEYRFWNVARTQAQILANMNNEISPGSTGLIAYYRFNEGSHMIVNDLVRGSLGTGYILPGAGWTEGGVSRISSGTTTCLCSPASFNTLVPVTVSAPAITCVNTSASLCATAGGVLSSAIDLNNPLYYNEGAYLTSQPLPQYVDYGSGNSPLSGLYSFTFELWIKPTQAFISSDRIFAFGDGALIYIFLSAHQNATNPAPKWGIAVRGGGAEQDVQAVTKLQDQQWYHIAITLNNATSTGSIYINGVLEGTNTGITIRPALLGNTPTNWIGYSQFSGDAYLRAVLTEIRVWNYARSQTQIQAAMNGTVPVNSFGLVSYLRCNEAGGTQLFDAVRGNYAQLINKVAWTTGVFTRSVPVYWHVGGTGQCLGPLVSGSTGQSCVTVAGATGTTYYVEAHDAGHTGASDCYPVTVGVYSNPTFSMGVTQIPAGCPSYSLNSTTSQYQPTVTLCAHSLNSFRGFDNDYYLGEQARAIAVVTSNADSGPGTLRQAIFDANSGDTIVFSAPMTIGLTGGELTVDKSLTIDGSFFPTLGAITISGNNLYRCFNIHGGASVVLRVLTIANGNDTFTTQFGGGIINYGDLTLDRCTVRNCSNVNVNAAGAGIFNSNTLTALYSTFNNNVSVTSGGAIETANPSIPGLTYTFLYNCTFAHNIAVTNNGGVIAIRPGATVNIYNCTMVGNTAVTGGAIRCNGANSFVTINNSIIAGNRCGTVGSDVGPDIAISNGTTTITNCIIGSSNIQSGGTPITPMNTLFLANPGPAQGTSLSVPLLGPLANNGGPTMTMLPGIGCTAIDFGNSALIAGLYNVDQRGFPRVSGNNVDAGAVEAQLVTWLAGGCTGTLVSTMALPPFGTTGGCFQVHPSTTTTYYARLDGCTNTCASTTVHIDGISLSPSGCSGLPFTLNGSTGFSGYTWFGGTGCSGSSLLNGISLPQTKAAGTYFYSLRAHDIVNGCTGCTPYAVVVSPAYTVQVTPSAPMITRGNIVVLTATSSRVGTTFTWTPTTGLKTSTGATVVASPTVTTTYTVNGLNGNCIESATVTVCVIDPSVSDTLLYCT